MNIKTFTVSFAAAALACAAFAQGGSALASRDIVDPVANIWEEGGWPTTTGEFGPLDARPSDPDAPKDHMALRLTVHYGPYSFGGWSAARGEQHRAYGKDE